MIEADETAEGAERERSAVQTLVRCGPLALAVLAVAVLLFTGAGRYLSLDSLRDQRALLMAMVHTHPYLSLLGYMGLYVAVVAFSLPGALVMSLSGGLLFGVWLGASAAVAGASTGAVLMFLVARSALGDALRARTKAGSVTHRIEAGVRRNAFSCILTLRLIPAIPFCLVNLGAGFVKMRLSTYWWATVLGIAPATAIYASVGAGLGQVFERGGHVDASTILQPHMFAPMVGLALLSTLPLAFQAWKRRRAQVLARA